MSTTAHAISVGLLHWVEDLGLLGGIGAFGVRRLGALRPRLPWVEPPIQTAVAVAFLGGVVLLVVTPSWTGAARAASEGVALALCVRRAGYAAAFVVLAAVLLPLTGHAANLPTPAAAELADAVHVVSAGIWAGGILAMAALSPPAGWRSAEAAALLTRFGRVAVIAFGVTALSGLINATGYLGGLSDLWSTTYGVVLAFKTLGVLVLMAASLAWRRGFSVARAEAVVVICVVAATAALSVLPLPAPAPETDVQLVQH